MNIPRRIPPWRRRDAEPGPIVVVLLISVGMTAMVLLLAYV